MIESLVVDDLTFALRWSDKRKTIGITIERDGALTVTAPKNCPLETIEQIATEKKFWIYQKQAEKNLLLQPPTEKEIVSGEGFYYLGRSYRLLLISPDAGLPLRLHQGRFQLHRNRRAEAQPLFAQWYTKHAKPWLQNQVKRLSDRISVQPKALCVQDLGYRWGSCSPNGSLNFHWRTILLPPRIIEYVVVHELVHLQEPHHNNEFWLRLERALPDYQTRKQWLADHGSQFSSV